MHVQIERPAEPLDDGHGAPATIRDALVARAGAQAARARRARTRRRPRGTDRGPTPAGTAGDTAGSAPTAAPARRGTRDRPGARRARPSGGRRNSDRSRALYTKTGRAGRGRRPRSETARTRRPASHTAESLGTPARRTAAAPPRPAATRPAHGRSRSGRARSGRGCSTRDRAVRTRSMAAPRAVHRRRTCQHAGPVKSGVNASIASARS